MPKRYDINLSEQDRADLASWVKNPPKAYLRPRARAILLVADGEPLYKVASHSRIRKHRKTITRWVQSYLNEGLAGLKVRPGQGRKPAFFPSGGRKSQS